MKNIKKKGILKKMKHKYFRELDEQCSLHFNPISYEKFGSLVIMLVVAYVLAVMLLCIEIFRKKLFSGYLK